MDKNFSEATVVHNRLPALGKIWWRWQLWLLPLPALFLYGLFLSNPPFFDDLNGPFWQFPVPRPEVITPRVVAWLSFLPSSYWPETALQTLHGGNVLIHLGNVFLAYFLIHTLMDIGVHSSNKNQRTENSRVALFGALLFSIHPVATYAAGYLIQRTILLTTFFGLLTTWVHLLAQIKGRQYWFVASSLFFLLALFSKEHIVMLPFFLGALSYWLAQQGVQWRRGWGWVFVVYALSSLLMVALIKSGVGFGAMYEPHAQIFFPDTANPYWTSLTSQLILFFKYLGLWFVPVTSGMSIDLQQNVFYYSLGWPGLVAAGLLVMLTTLAIKHRKSGLFSLAWFWAFMLFFSEFWAIRLSEGFVLYRSYLWMIPVPFVISWGVMQLAKLIGNRISIVFVILIAGGYAYATWNRLDSMSSSIKVWKDAVEKNNGVTWPMASRAHSTLGAYLAGSGQLGEAQKHFHRAVELNPLHATAWCNLTNIYRLRNQADVAATMLTRAIQANPVDPCVVELLGNRSVR